MRGFSQFSGFIPEGMTTVQLSGKVRICVFHPRPEPLLTHMFPFRSSSIRMSIRTFAVLAFTLSALCLGSATVSAQSVPVVEALAAHPDQDGGDSAPAPKTTSGAVEIDPFLAIGVVDADKFRPLTGGERWKLYAKSTFFSPGAFFGAVIPAAFDQAGNAPPEWGGGMKGYGRRVASRFGVRTITETFQHGGAAAFGQDPRYIRSSEKGFLKRTRHALAFVFVTYNNEGKIRPAYGKVGGIYGGAFTQIAWMPDRFNVRGDGVRFGNVGMAVQLLNNFMLEFGPDLRKIFRRRK